MSQFLRYLGIDYSGAKTAHSALPGLQVFEATPDRAAEPVEPQGRHWLRRELAQWLVEQLATGPATLVGIDHAFSFPVAYLERFHLRTWDDFLEDFWQHWPTDTCGAVEMVRTGNPRTGTRADGLRMTEKWTSSAKCVFQWDMQGSVAKSTHAGIPWLRDLRRHARLEKRVFFWPFDGFTPLPGRSLVAEVYPSILRHRYAAEGRTADAQDAYAVARWFRDTDRHGFMGRYLDVPLTEHSQGLAQREGWILGVA